MQLMDGNHKTKVANSIEKTLEEGLGKVGFIYEAAKSHRE